MNICIGDGKRMKVLLLAALGGAGAILGLALSGGWPAQRPAIDAVDSPHVEDGPRLLTRLPLSALDTRDTIEAPEVAADAGGRAFLAWASKTGEKEQTVFIARTDASSGSCESPRVLSRGGIYKSGGRGDNGGYERRATPHIAIDGQCVHVIWCEAAADGSAARMVLATSTDAAETFGPAQPVHQGEKANPSFTAGAHGPGGMLACAWLDSREGAQLPFAALRSPGAAAFHPEQMVSPGQPGKGVCPCCPTAAAFAADGTLFVAFRNIHDGYRDIAVSRLRPGHSTFEGPFAVMENTWKFDGCPHDGPSLAIIGDTLFVAWMDARSGPQRCYCARANLAEMKFQAQALNPAGGGTQGCAKLSADASGNLHAVWEESLGAEPIAKSSGGHQHGPPKITGTGGRAIHYAMMPAGQSAFGPERAIAPKAGAFQTRPSIAVAANGHVFIAWNELDATGKSVVAYRLPARKENAPE